LSADAMTPIHNGYFLDVRALCRPQVDNRSHGEKGCPLPDDSRLYSFIVKPLNRSPPNNAKQGAHGPVPPPPPQPFPLIKPATRIFSKPGGYLEGSLITNVGRQTAITKNKRRRMCASCGTTHCSKQRAGGHFFFPASIPSDYSVNLVP